MPSVRRSSFPLLACLLLYGPACTTEKPATSEDSSESDQDDDSDESSDDDTSDDSEEDDDDSASLDAGSKDASTKDASSKDASTKDASTSDASSKDASASDAGSKDASTSDAAASGDAGATEDGGATTTEKFSFFVTSLRAMRELSGSQNGFGGDLRFGETGDGAGLRGADKICATIAETSLPGAGSKVWRAFLSTVKGGTSNGPVHAADRVGAGPWYDRLGRLVAMTKTDLIQVRPNANAAIKNDLPNEEGVPNHNPDGTGEVDNHDILTGTNDKGQLYASDIKVTCNDWTKSAGDSADAPRVGHSWPRGGGGGRGGQDNWMSSLNEAGCAAGVSIVEMGAPRESNPTVGSGGGYGGIYCFALTP